MDSWESSVGVDQYIDRAGTVLWGTNDTRVRLRYDWTDVHEREV